MTLRKKNYEPQPPPARLGSGSEDVSRGGQATPFLAVLPVLESSRAPLGGEVDLLGNLSITLADEVSTTTAPVFRPPKRLLDRESSPAPTRARTPVVGPSSAFVAKDTAPMARPGNPAGVLSAHRRLEDAGIHPINLVKTAPPPAAWKVGIQANDGSLYCPTERILLYTPDVAVPSGIVAEYAQVTPSELERGMAELVERGYLEVTRENAAIRSTPLGCAVVMYRLTEPDEASCTQAGHARLFAANMAMTVGEWDGVRYAQNILDIVGRGQDEGRKSSLIALTSVAARELVTRLEPGMGHPIHLDAVADHLRWALPKKHRAEVEEYLVALRDAQCIANLAGRLEAADSDHLPLVATDPGTYADMANRPLSQGTYKRMATVTLRTLEDAGQATPDMAARVGSAVLQAGKGALEDKAGAVHNLRQLSEVLPPTLVIRAASASPEALRAFGGHFRMDHDQATYLLHQMGHPVLVEAAGDVPRLMQELSVLPEQSRKRGEMARHLVKEEMAQRQRAMGQMVALSEALGHPMPVGSPDYEALEESLASIQATDRCYHTLVRSLVRAGVESSDQRDDLLTHLAVQIASNDAVNGVDPYKNEATLRVLGLLANGATAGDLERACYAAHGIAEHPLEIPEQKLLARGIEATTRTILIAAAGRVPNADERNRYLQSIEAAHGPAQGMVLQALRRGVSGQGVTEEQAPDGYAYTFAQANLASFVAATTVQDLQGIVTMQALELAGQKLRNAHQQADPPPPEVKPSLGLEAPNQPSLRNFDLGRGAMIAFIPKGEEWDSKAILACLAKANKFPDTNLVVLGAKRNEALHVATLVPLDTNQEEEDLITRSVAGTMKLMDQGSCQLVKLGTRVDQEMAEVMRKRLREAGVTYRVIHVPDDAIAQAIAETSHPKE